MLDKTISLLSLYLSANQKLSDRLVVIPLVQDASDRFLF